MLKFTWKYTNYNGEVKEITKTFNLNKVELLNMQVSKEYGLDKLIIKASREENASVLLPLFQEIILKSYGELSADNESFIKKDENGVPLSNKFEQSAAYEALYMLLLKDADKAANFVKGLVPDFNLSPEQKKIVDEKVNKQINNPNIKVLR